MFDYDTWLSTPPEPPIDILEIDEDEDRAYDEMERQCSNGLQIVKEKRK